MFYSNAVIELAHRRRRHLRTRPVERLRALDSKNNFDVVKAKNPKTQEINTARYKSIPFEPTIYQLLGYSWFRHLTLNESVRSIFIFSYSTPIK